MSVANMLRNGMGGYDWAGLPLACEIFRVADIEMLVRRLLIIKNYRPPEP